MKELAELVIIIDRSGSMHGLEKDVIGGFNALIEAQRKEGPARVTTIFFNDRTRFIHEAMDIQEVKPLEAKHYSPSGTTALLDAIGDAISLIKSKHAALPIEELPKDTIFSIMTDGLENASREYSYSKVKEMIEMQKKCGWTFLFQAANIDVVAEASRLGVDAAMAMAFEADPEGVKRSMHCACACISEKRRSKKN